MLFKPIKNVTYCYEGFTAWSSVREPVHVFTLLESIYHTFDEMARKQRIYKVETIGDCYVAVCGLPDPRKDHAGKFTVGIIIWFAICFFCSA